LQIFLQGENAVAGYWSQVAGYWLLREPMSHVSYLISLLPQAFAESFAIASDSKEGYGLRSLPPAPCPLLPAKATVCEACSPKATD